MCCSLWLLHSHFHTLATSGLPGNPRCQQLHSFTWGFSLAARAQACCGISATSGNPQPKTGIYIPQLPWLWGRAIMRCTFCTGSQSSPVGTSPSAHSANLLVSQGFLSFPVLPSHFLQCCLGSPSKESNLHSECASMEPNRGDPPCLLQPRQEIRGAASATLFKPPPLISLSSMKSFIQLLHSPSLLPYSFCVTDEGIEAQKYLM